MTTSGAAHRVRMAWPLRRLMVLMLALAGAAILLYPSAGAWFAARADNQVIAALEQQVEEMPAQVRQAELQAAHRYNDTLPPRPMKDPYSDNTTDAPVDATRRYDHTLDAIDGGVMGVLRVPTIDVNLPIYHGTGEAALEKGVGHLFGSTLPVGGPNTHSVLTAHSGMVGHTLFDHLRDVALGDRFQVDVLGQTRTYQVDSIQTVLPDQTDSLVRVAGKDYITLITCTPTGVNTHRLLVRGVRVPNDAVEPIAHYNNGLTGAGFPWWALIGIGVFCVLVLVTRRLRREDSDVTTSRQRPSLRIVAGLTLVTAGLALVGFLLWEFYGTTWVSHHHAQEALAQVDRGWDHQESTVATAWGDATAIVKIPRFGSSYRVPLFEGTDDTVLAAGFGHITGTARPGEIGNFVIAAHRVTHGEPLRLMPELAVGDRVIIETRGTTYEYKLVTGGDALVVPFTAEWVTTPRPHNPVREGVEPPAAAGERLLTLTTCAELFHTDNRLVAFGQLQPVYPTATAA